MTKHTRRPESVIGLITISLTLFVSARALPAPGSCLIPEVAQGFEQAKAVFIGEVEEIIPPRSENADGEFFDRAHLIKFKVERSWKGASFGPVTVWAIQGARIFALPRISKGERYLVYAEAVTENEVATDQLLVNDCNRTALLPLNAKRQKRIMEPVVDRENGANDIAALDSMLILKRR